MWYDWQPQPIIVWDDLERICPAGEYQVIKPNQVPDGMISPGLLANCHSVLVLCSGTASGRVYAMFNLNRIDNTEIDQMPYCIAFDGNEPIPSGILIQHANYPGRTTPLPADFYPYISASGTYQLQGMPQNDNGLLTELNTGSQEEAFRLLVTVIEKNIPEDE